MSIQNLRSKTLNSALIVSFAHILSQIIRLATNLILTRILAPDMFGLMSAAYTINFGLSLFSDIGLSQNLIQNKNGNDTKYINTLWSLQIIRGLLIFLVGLLVALILIGLNHFNFFDAHTVYASNELPLIIVLTLLNSLICGFTSTNVALAIRNLQLLRKTILDVVGQVVNVVITVILAYYFRNVWSLIASAILGSIYTVYVSHRFLKGEKNYWIWDTHYVNEIINFGKWIFISSVLGFFTISGDRFVLGAMISTSALGVYSIAYFLSNALIEILNKLLGFTALPALSEVFRTEPTKLKSIYYKLRMPVDMICLFISGVLFMSGHIVVDILYDNRYKEAGDIMEILSLSLLFARFSLAEQLFIALGKPNLLVPINFMKAIAVIIIMPVVFHLFGYKAAIYVIAFIGAFSLPLVFYNKVKFGLMHIKRELMVIPLFFLGLLLGECINLIDIKLI